MKKLIIVLLLTIGCSLSIFCSAQTTVFYGLTSEGGNIDEGAIIRFNPITNAEDTVHSFGRGDDGDTPYGNLIYDAGNGLFYGMTYYGGILSSGTIIKFNPITNAEDTVHCFGRGMDGTLPCYGALTYDAGNGLYYGMTPYGGTLGDGVLFSFNPITNVEDTIHCFGRGLDGQNPGSNLVYDAGNGLFYGMTLDGGNMSGGTIITFNPITNVEDTVYSFGHGNDGFYPYGNLTYYAGNGLFYGMTSSGGTLDDGAIISFNPITNVENVVHSFGHAHDGQDPIGSLVYDAGNGLFYGMTWEGGRLGDGVIFSFNPITNVEDTLHSFGRGTDGQDPEGELIYYPANGLFYGLTMSGGASGVGVIFSFNPITNVEDTVHSFGRGNDGQSPYQNLIAYTPLCTISASTASVIQNELCNGDTNGSAHATITGGVLPFTYLWSPGGETKDTANGLSAGSYTVTVYDYNGCTASASVTITQPLAINVSVNVTANASCNGGNNGSASSTVSGGTSPYTYLWETSGQTNAITTGLSAGTYTLTVHDNNGCTATASVTITQPLVLTLTSSFVNSSSIAPCNGQASVNATGGTAPYTYLWNPGGGTTQTITGKCKGTYCCNITDANGCTASSCVTIASTAGIDNITSGSGEITVYPNPSSGTFTLRVESEKLKVESVTVEVYNVLGEKVLNATLNQVQSDNTIDLSAHPNGIYLYRVISESGGLIGEGKLIIQK